MLHNIQPTVILITPRDFPSNYKRAECSQDTAAVLISSIVWQLSNTKYSVDIIVSQENLEIAQYS